MENDGIIYLTELRFPQHGLVQAWLNGTEYGKKFELMATQVTTARPDGTGGEDKKILFVPALKPIKGEDEFMYALQGHELTQKLAKKYTSMVLDFSRK